MGQEEDSRGIGPHSAVASVLMSIYTEVWIILLTGAFIFEGFTIFNKTKGDTLSENTRVWFHITTKLGRAIFLVAWAGFSVWFAVHVLTGWV